MSEREWNMKFVCRDCSLERAEMMVDRLEELQKQNRELGRCVEKREAGKEVGGIQAAINEGK